MSDEDAPIPMGARFPLLPDSYTGRAVFEQRTVHGVGASAGPSASGYRPLTHLAIPLRQRSAVIGVLMVTRGEVRRFSDSEVALLETFADQAVIAIENARLFDELEQRNTELQESNRQVTEALEQQTATDDVLRVIAASPTDLGAVLDAVLASAAALTNGEFGSLWYREGDFMRRLSAYPFDNPAVRAARGRQRPVASDSISGRAILEAQPVQLLDSWERGTWQADAYADEARNGGWRTNMAVPLLSRGEAIGTLSIGRGEVREFSAHEVALLETFADQAVIAIENARLFMELEQRNTELQESNRQVSEALEQQTATAEILRVIASSPTDVQHVLQAIVASAARICDADIGDIRQIDSTNREGAPIRISAAFGESPLNAS